MLGSYGVGFSSDYVDRVHRRTGETGSDAVRRYARTVERWSLETAARGAARRRLGDSPRFVRFVYAFQVAQPGGHPNPS